MDKIIALIRDEEVARTLKVVTAIYLVSTIADIVTTYWLVYITGAGVELNPCTRSLLETWGPLVWFLRDMAIYAIILLLIATTQKAITGLSKHSPPIFDSYFRYLRKAWKVFLAETVILRLLPAANNIIILILLQKQPFI